MFPIVLALALAIEIGPPKALPPEVEQKPRASACAPAKKNECPPGFVPVCEESGSMKGNWRCDKPRRKKGA